MNEAVLIDNNDLWDIEYGIYHVTPHIQAVKTSLNVGEFISMNRHVYWSNFVLANTSYGLIVSVDVERICILFLPVLTDAIRTTYNISGLHESKVACYEELYVSKYYTYICQDAVNDIIFVFHLNALMSNQRIVQYGINSVKLLRYRQTREDILIDVKLYPFPDEHSDYQIFHSQSYSATIWNDINVLSTISTRVMNSGSQKMGRVGNVSQSTVLSRYGIDYIKSHSTFKVKTVNSSLHSLTFTAGFYLQNVKTKQKKTLIRYELEQDICSLRNIIGPTFRMGFNDRAPFAGRTNKPGPNRTINYIHGYNEFDEAFSFRSRRRGIDLITNNCNFTVLVKFRFKQAIIGPSGVRNDTYLYEPLKGMILMRREPTEETKENVGESYLILGAEFNYQNKSYAIREINANYLVCTCFETGLDENLNNLDEINNIIRNEVNNI